MKSMYASRSVPVLNTPAPDAAYVDDSSSQNESLQRKADMANGAVQRVAQRETGVVQRVDDFPIDQFVYRAPENNDLKFKEGCIVFTEYSPNLVSSGFTGCMMMAFKFKQSYTCNNYAGGTITVGTDNQSYIAHVFCSDDVADTKNALYDAEKSGLITIETLIKPSNPSNVDELKAGRFNGTLTGEMTKTHNGWIANVNARKWIGSSLSEDEENFKHFNEKQVQFETLATKALLYASVLVKKALASDVVVDELKEYVVFKVNSNSIPRSLKLIKNCDPEAWNNLVRISFCGKEYIKTAIAISSNDNDKLILSLFLK